MNSSKDFVLPLFLTNKRPSIILFDIDGTIADPSHRLHLIPPTNPQWEAFFLSCDEDLPLPLIMLFKEIIGNLNYLYEVHIWTGRWELAMEPTIHWLIRYTSIPWKIWEDLILTNRFRFAPNGDTRPTTVYKNSLWEELSKEDQARILLTFDDETKMVQFWAARNITCLQVQTPN